MRQGGSFSRSHACTRTCTHASALVFRSPSLTHAPSLPGLALCMQMKARVKAALDSAQAEPGAPIQAEALKPERWELGGHEEQDPGTMSDSEKSSTGVVEAAKAPSAAQ